MFDFQRTIKTGDQVIANGFVGKVESVNEISFVLEHFDGRKSEMTYDEFVDWKNQQAFKEYDYKKMYLAGGK